MQSRSFLPMLAVLTVAASCSGGNDTTFPPAAHDTGVEDALVDGDVGDVEDVIDATADVGPQGLDIPPVPIDLGGNPPEDSGMMSIEDTGPTTAGVCPAACAASSDCDPCWGAGEAHGSNNYCCVSGLCIFRTGTCDTTTPVDGGSSSGDGGGLDSSTGTDASSGADG